MSVPSLAQKSNALKRLFSVRTKSDAVKNERLAKVALYADKKDVKRKKDPVVVIDVSLRWR